MVCDQSFWTGHFDYQFDVKSNLFTEILLSFSESRRQNGNASKNKATKQNVIAVDTAPMKKEDKFDFDCIKMFIDQHRPHNNKENHIAAWSIAI